MWKLKGFMARTHAVLSICFLMLCMMIPIELFKKTVWLLKENIFLFIVGLVITVGGSLLPDLDNNISKAGVTLGPLGSMFTVFMQSTSHIVWSVYRGKRDRPPISQHRYLWHTPIIAIGIISLFYFGIKPASSTIYSSISTSLKQGQFGYFIQTNSVLFLFILLAFMATLVGSSILIAKINELFKLPSLIKYILPIFVLIYVATIDMNTIRILGVCLGLGYLFHIIEDFFADSGIPLIWPIPAFWCKKVWWRSRFIVTVKTGGISNTIVDFVAVVTAIALIITVFARR